MLSKFKNEKNSKIYAESVGFITEWKKKPYTLTNKQIDILAYICKEIGHPVRDKKCGVCLKQSCEIVEAYIKNYQDLNANTIDGILSNYDPRELYETRTILLLGNGKISKKMHAQRKKYDIIVGINQIYKSPIYKHIDIHYHALSKHDTDFLSDYLTISDGKTLILKPNRNIAQLDIIRNMLKNNSNILFNVDDKGLNKKIGNPLSGIWVLEDILEGNPLSIDILGFDFYASEDNNYEILPNNPKVDKNVHNLEANKQRLQDILENNENVTHYA